MLGRRHGVVSTILHFEFSLSSQEIRLNKQKFGLRAWATSTTCRPKRDWLGMPPLDRDAACRLVGLSLLFSLVNSINYCHFYQQFQQYDGNTCSKLIVLLCLLHSSTSPILQLQSSKYHFVSRNCLSKRGCSL